jgi:hypothetical protein
MKNGVVIHLLPLTEIVKEKTASSNIKAGFILMSGETKTMEGEDSDEAECEVTFSIEDVTSGNIEIIFCHPESLLSEKGAAILTQLIRQDLLICVVPDEFHKSLHWGQEDEDLPKESKEQGAFRAGMIDVLQQIKARAPTVPFLLETATLMKEEVKKAKELLMIDPIIIFTSPVLEQHKFINVKRPDQSAGFFGKKARGGKPRKEGLLDYLRPLIIDPLKKTLALPREERNVMMVFCRDKDTIALIDQVTFG